MGRWESDVDSLELSADRKKCPMQRRERADARLSSKKSECQLKTKRGKGGCSRKGWMGG